MRIPQPSQKTSFRATKPSTPPSTVRTTGPQGTPGGKRKPGSAGKQYQPGQEVYLWILVVLEIILTGGFRRFFRRVHGG